MNQLLSDPRMIDYLIQSQPSLQQMGPGIRQVMQSDEFRRTMTDPNMLRNMMEMNRMFSQMGMQVPGMPGAPRQPGFPAPGVTNTTAPQQAQHRSATPTPQASQQNPQANPFEAMFSPTAQQAPQQQGQAANPFAALFAPPPAGQQQPPQPFQAGATNPQSPFGASYQPSAFPTGQTPAQNPFAPAGQQQPDLGQMISMLQSLQQLQTLFQGGQPGGVASPIGPVATSPPPVADTRPIEERFQVPEPSLSHNPLTFSGGIASIE
jgi:ubiquilin